MCRSRVCCIDCRSIQKREVVYFERSLRSTWGVPSRTSFWSWNRWNLDVDSATKNAGEFTLVRLLKCFIHSLQLRYWQNNVSAWKKASTVHFLLVTVAVSFSFMDAIIKFQLAKASQFSNSFSIKGTGQMFWFVDQISMSIKCVLMTIFRAY